MSDISNVDRPPKGLREERSSDAKQRWNLQDCILLLPFFLLFIGDFQLPVGDSNVTIPIGMALVFPAFFWYLITGNLKFSAASLLLACVLFCGLLGFIFTPTASFFRSVAGALPIVFSALTIIVYERFPVSQEKPYKTCQSLWFLNIFLKYRLHPQGHFGLRVYLYGCPWWRHQLQSQVAPTHLT